MKRRIGGISPSGVGKSSLVRAGLIPALNRGAVPDADTWNLAVMRPGRHPLRSLSEKILAVPGVTRDVDSESVTAMLASDPTAQLQFYTAEDEIPSVSNYFGILPPRVQGPTNVDAGTPIPSIHMASNEGFDGTDRYTILEMDVDFTTPANTTLTRTDLAATAFNQNLCGFARDCIPQPGTTRGLDSFGGNTLFQAPIRDLDPTEDVDLRLLS